MNWVAASTPMAEGQRAAQLATSAYFLVAHGSRDPRHFPALTGLADAVTARLQQVGESSEMLVGRGFLELQDVPLHQQIVNFGERAIAQNRQHLYVLPLFLLPGVHVMEDIPAEVAIAQTRLQSRLSLTTTPYLGASPQFIELLSAHLPQSPNVARILLSHGTRRPGGNRPIETMAKQLDMTVAYWSLEPGLDAQIQHCLKRGYTEICVMPYVLFPGGITDAIAQTLQQFSQTTPRSHFWQTPPLNAQLPLANYIVDTLLPGCV